MLHTLRVLQRRRASCDLCVPPGHNLDPTSRPPLHLSLSSHLSQAKLLLAFEEKKRNLYSSCSLNIIIFLLLVSLSLSSLPLTLLFILFAAKNLMTLLNRLIAMETAL